MSEHVVVVGGGIGGLALALAVSARGHRATVLERSAEFAELGAGIQLAPNGLHALARLGLGTAVRPIATPMDELRFMDGVTGAHVVSMPLTATYQRRFGSPYAVVHRGHLFGLLLDACRSSPGVELRADSPVAGYTQDNAGATAVLASGERVTGTLLVGADGIRSTIREQLVGDGEPRVSGITVYRSIIPIEEVPPPLRSAAVTWWAGPKCHFVHYPIGGGRFLNLAASSDDGVTEAFAGVPATTDRVRREFQRLPAARHLLDLGRDWRAWVLVDREPVDDWCDGRVTLLGDAAHPMLHYAAQGACQALEDAVLLAELVDRGPAGLVEYQERRRDRTAAIQRISRESIRLWHPEGAAAQARNRMLAAMTAERLHDEVAWMHEERIGVAG
ncbi:FAD-dependent monooxygenase [Dactylosporangium sp. NPDC000555]|uniref:FAD-dependent monooxygenase n=1 Tax=Dactylosporangium sp. NPDC000555 TaxID=3154260 RepID=UPI003328AA41